ncbi:MAG: ion channel [Sandaracinaceae bacterium]
MSDSPARRERRPLDAYLHRVGQRSRPLTDVYAYLLRARWRTVVTLSFGLYLAFNLVFGALYWLAPGAVANTDGSFLDAFFFSVQSFAAIGYGYMYADGVVGNVLVTLEAFASLFSIALLTGIVFAKFARPHARVLFSENALIETRNGKPTLTFRLANERGNDVVEASIRVSVLQNSTTEEGKRLRRFHDLRLERESTPVFILSWQVFHTIDEESPLYGLTEQDLLDGDVRVTVALTGLDGTFAQTIHSRHMYLAEDIVFGRRFVDVIENRDRDVVMHFERFHDHLPDDGTADPAFD